VYDFTVEMGKNIRLNDRYECALIDAKFEIPELEADEEEEVCEWKRDPNLFIFCDLCETSYIRDNFFPLLRMIKINDNILTPLYNPISRYEFNKVRVYIRTIDMNIPLFMFESFTCTIHFKTSP